MMAAALLCVSGTLGVTGLGARHSSASRIVTSRGTADDTFQSGVRAAAVPLTRGQHDYGRPSGWIPPVKGEFTRDSRRAVNLTRLRDIPKRVVLLARRDPFVFAPDDVPVKPAPSRIGRAAPQPPRADDAPAIPLSLIGIAASDVDGRVERTALITGPGDALFYAREGDTVLARFRADAVQPDRVLLTDLVTGSPSSLMLR
jgi:hypothetical protein